MQTCVTCEKPLPFKSPPPSPPPPPPAPPLPNPTTLRPVSGSSYAMCAMCGRVNVSDARFCDWCGSKVRLAEPSTVDTLTVTRGEYVRHHSLWALSCITLLEVLWFQGGSKVPLYPRVDSELESGYAASSANTVV